MNNTTNLLNSTKELINNTNKVQDENNLVKLSDIAVPSHLYVSIPNSIVSTSKLTSDKQLKTPTQPRGAINAYIKLISKARNFEWAHKSKLFNFRSKFYA